MAQDGFIPPDQLRQQGAVSFVLPPPGAVNSPHLSDAGLLNYPNSAFFGEPSINPVAGTLGDWAKNVKAGQAAETGELTAGQRAAEVLVRDALNGGDTGLLERMASGQLLPEGVDTAYLAQRAGAVLPEQCQRAERTGAVVLEFTIDSRSMTFWRSA